MANIKAELERLERISLALLSPAARAAWHKEQSKNELDEKFIAGRMDRWSLPPVAAEIKAVSAQAKAIRGEK